MSLKRKAAHGSIPSFETPDNKRRRGPDQVVANANETPQRTTQVGLEFIEKLKLSKDKQEHLIASHFHRLPDPNELPDYYQVIQLPIALETIEAKLQRFEYSNISAIESDLKRMISNAKTYNEKNSEVHNDAEKIRKLVSNQFKEINPAYADPSYTALPTPLPGEPGAPQQSYALTLPPPTPTPATAPQTGERPKRSLNLRGPKEPPARSSQTPTVSTSTPVSTSKHTAAATGSGDFSGKTFQQAQEMILQELCELTNDDGELISAVFLQLPSRALKDYYAAIKHPESLKGLQKKAVGKVGHAEPTGISQMKTWAEFESQTSLVWRNAQSYNEDGSEIFNLARELEKYFNKRLAEAKAVIPDPARPKVKLNVSAKSPEPPAANPRITLNVGPRPSPGGVAVDTEALKRQQEMIKSVTTVPARPSGGAADHPSAALAISQSPPVAVNGLVKPEISTPNLASVVPAPEVNGSMVNGHAMIGMPPPAIAARPLSGSPFPPTVMPYYPSHSAGAIETKVRAQGKTSADALIQSLDVRTHPSLQQIPEDDKIEFTFLPADKLTQQSYTISVSQPHSFVRVQPAILPQAALRTTKLGVNLQGHKVQTVQQQYQRELADNDPRRPIYDIPLQEGQVNRIEVWMLAGPARGAPKVGTGQDIEFEKYTLFIQRLRD